MKPLIYLIICRLAFINIFAQQNLKHLEIPKLKEYEQIIEHTGYTLSYNEAYEQANWVAYQLTDTETVAIVKRSNHFMEDPMVKTLSANDADYANSGYDRGHLAPAADMSYSLKTMEESFYYSNMSPQNPSFNRGIWKSLEEQARHWAINNHVIYIVTGPVLTDSLSTIGLNKVAVPNYFYKVILSVQGQHLHGIGFIIPNKASHESIKHYAVTIDSVEAFTHLDFFDSLADEQEEAMERLLILDAWDWNSMKPSNNLSPAIQESTNKVLHHSNDEQSVSVQCSATTQKGTRCKKFTKNASGKCYLHE